MNYTKNLDYASQDFVRTSSCNLKKIIELTLDLIGKFYPKIRILNKFYVDL